MKNIFKILPLVVVMVFLVACGTENPGQDNPEQENTDIEISGDNMEQYLSELKAFSGNEKNFVFSPISLNSALYMYKYTEDGESSTKAIDKFLFDRDYLAYEYDTPTYTSTNRIWKNEKVKVKFDPEVEEFVYEMDMSDSQKATKEKNDFVAEKTNNFISKTPTVFSEQTVYDIMNVTYFKDTWLNGDLGQESQKTDFNNIDGSKTGVKMLTCGTEEYYENDTAYGVPIKYSNGCSMILILPKGDFEDVSFKELLDDKQYNTMGVNVRFPEFETESQFDLTQYFDQMGIGLSGKGILFSQIAKIKVDKKGTEAAAVTEMLRETALAPEGEPLNLLFDRPFYYAIYDYVNDDVAFMGKVSQL